MIQASLLQFMGEEGGGLLGLFRSTGRPLLSPSAPHSETVIGGEALCYWGLTLAEDSGRTRRHLWCFCLHLFDPVKTLTVCLRRGIMTDTAVSAVWFRSQDTLWESDQGVTGRVNPTRLQFQSMRGTFWEVTTDWSGSLSRRDKH